MNLLLFHPSQRQDNGHVRVSGRQYQHLRETLDAKIGDSIKVGEINGKMGQGIVIEKDSDHCCLEISIDKHPPPALPLKMVLALPRPKMMRRILQTIATMGVKELHLINSYRVEKSFWQSPWLKEESIEQQLVLGLEQACDTVMPNVHLHKRFKPFVEDMLPEIISGTKAYVAHPYTDTPCPTGLTEKTSLSVGPEGGFIPYEIEKLGECGFQPITLGPRILRVETAIPVLISTLFR